MSQLVQEPAQASSAIIQGDSADVAHFWKRRWAAASASDTGRRLMILLLMSLALGSAAAYEHGAGFGINSVGSNCFDASFWRIGFSCLDEHRSQVSIAQNADRDVGRHGSWR